MTRINLFYAILALSISITTEALCQNWQPFNQDREYYWIQTEDSMTILESIVIPETSSNIFNSELCEFWFPEKMLDYYRYNSSVINRDKPAYFFDFDERILINDYSESTGDWFDLDFRYSASPGETWTSRGFEFICDSVYTMQIIGETDSVKSIRCTTVPLDTIQFILSKNHGFIKYSPLRNFHDTSLIAPRPYFYLSGYRTDSTETGLTQPQFEDYFNQQPGDVLVWREVMTLNTTDTIYAVDTIQAVEYLAGSVRYETRRGIYDINWQLQEVTDTSHIYNRSFEGIILESPISWITDPDSLTFIHRMEPQKVKLDVDTSVVARVINTASSMEMNDCMFNFWTDVTARYAYESGRGMIHRFSGGLGGFYQADLIGSVIDGKEVGDTDLPVTSSSSTPAHIELQVYPNPAASHIRIRGFDRFVSCIVYDQLGRVVIQHDNKSIIDIADLTPGDYILEVELSEGILGLAKFIVAK